MEFVDVGMGCDCGVYLERYVVLNVGPKELEEEGNVPFIRWVHIDGGSFLESCLRDWGIEFIDVEELYFLIALGFLLPFCGCGSDFIGLCLACHGGWNWVDP